MLETKQQDYLHVCVCFLSFAEDFPIDLNKVGQKKSRIVREAFGTLQQCTCHRCPEMSGSW